MKRIIVLIIFSTNLALAGGGSVVEGVITSYNKSYFKIRKIKKNGILKKREKTVRLPIRVLPVEYRRSMEKLFNKHVHLSVPIEYLSAK